MSNDTGKGQEMGMRQTDAYVERALELPAGSLRAWREGEPPPEARALLRIIGLFPWVLEVADQRFSADAARAVVARESARACFPSSGDPGQDVADLLSQVVAEGRRSSHASILAELAQERLSALRGTQENPRQDR